jgi:hypothetical protein
MMEYTDMLHDFSSLSHGSCETSLLFRVEKDNKGWLRPRVERVCEEAAKAVYTAQDRGSEV